jgi:hypothetical protein
VLRAYNDWRIDEWAETYPGRIIPMAPPVRCDAKECARKSGAWRQARRDVNRLNS